MNVLLLSPYPDSLLGVISATDSVVTSGEPVTLEWTRERQIDLIVSYGYRHIIKEPLLSAYPNKIINLHISYLPWNRGADPNFWSWYEKTPQGVSLHYIDSGIDTGPILAQRLVDFSRAETLESSYAGLKRSLELLFAEKWPQLRVGAIEPTIQPEGGSYHAARAKRELDHLFPLGHKTPVDRVIEMGEKSRS